MCFVLGAVDTWFHLILISALWRKGSFTDTKTKAQAKSVWLIQGTFTSLSNSLTVSWYIQFLIEAWIYLIKMLSNENSSFQVISFVKQKAQSLLNREKNAQASIMIRPLSGK